jgi:DNA-directed RNA polymerase specialized sigma24 family protein
MTADQLDKLIDRHAGALVLYARQWTDTPEDVVQTALLKLVRLGRPPENPVPWLYTVVRNAARDAQRTPNWFDPDSATGLDGETATEALSELPDDVREIVVAHLWGGLTFEQIAATVGGSASTAYRRYVAGITALRSSLGVPCPK